VASIGMLHIGVVFIVFGLFLVGAGIIPDDITEQAVWSLFGNFNSLGKLFNLFSPLPFEKKVQM
jgi:hypothetical protein